MTKQAPFDLDQLEQHLDVHGSVLERWPDDVQPAARQLLESSSEARAAWARAERLAALLNAAPDILPSAALQARIAALPARHPRGWAAWWPFGNPVAPLLAWAAAGVIGVFVGSSSLPGFELDAGEDPAAALLAEPWEDDAADPAASDPAAGDEWSEIELALGLDPEWEEEP
jgi:hypothetical protein